MHFLLEPMETRKDHQRVLQKSLQYNLTATSHIRPYETHDQYNISLLQLPYLSVSLSELLSVAVAGVCGGVDGVRPI